MNPQSTTHNTFKLGLLRYLSNDQLATIQSKRVGIGGDRTTNSHDGHPPMAPRVTQCAAMMAEIVLDLTLGLAR